MRLDGGPSTRPMATRPRFTITDACNRPCNVGEMRQYQVEWEINRFNLDMNKIFDLCRVSLDQAQKMAKRRDIAPGVVRQGFHAKGGGLHMLASYREMSDRDRKTAMATSLAHAGAMHSTRRLRHTTPLQCCRCRSWPHAF